MSNFDELPKYIDREYLLHPLQASPASQVLAESERNRADLAVAHGQHLNVNHQKPAVEMGLKKTSWKPATSMPPVAEKMFRTLGSYAIIATYDTDVCVHYDGP